MHNQDMVLDFLRWELEQVLATRNAVFQRAAILLGLVGVPGALLASAVPATAVSPRDFTPLEGVLTIGLMPVGYAAYLTLRCLWAKRTLLRKLLGPQVL